MHPWLGHHQDRDDVPECAEDVDLSEGQEVVGGRAAMEVTLVGILREVLEDTMLRLGREVFALRQYFLL